MTNPETPRAQQDNDNLWMLQKYALDKHAIVAITDRDGRITYVNNLFCDISGFSREEILGKSHHLVNSGFHPKGFFREMFETINTQGFWRGEICNRRKNGELYWVESTISALKDKDGAIEGFIALRTDVTDQHRTLEAMRRLHDITSARDTSVGQKAHDILELGCEIFNLPLGIISHISDNVYTVRHCISPEGGLQPGQTFELGNTYCSETMACDAPVAHHNVGKSSFSSHPAYENFRLEAYIGAPLVVDGTVFGTINFSGPLARERAFSSGELELIQLFSKWIGDAFARHDTDNELERQRLLLKSVSEQARIGAWEIDFDRNELYWSRMTRVIHEVDDDFVPTVDNAIDFYADEESRELIRNCVDRAINHGENWAVELPLRTAQGNLIWVNARGQADIRNGRCIRLFGSFQDITQQREAKAKEYEQAQRHQLMLESTAVGFWDWNIQTGETAFSERWAEIIGYELHELEPVSIDTWLHQCHPDDLQKSSEALEKHWRGETSLYVCEARMRHKDGHWVWVHDTGRVVEWDKQKKPLRMLGTHLDITESKRAEATIDESHRRIRLATESAGIGVWEYEVASGSMSWDERMLQLYGLDSVTFDGSFSTFTGMIHPEDITWVTARIQDALRFSAPFDYEFRIIRADGRVRYLRAAAHIVNNEFGEPERMVGINYDITHQKESEQTILRAKKEAEAAARAKSEFLATMSHEIRTPMNGVLGMLNLLQNTPLSEDQLNRIRIAQNSAQSLLALINDILDFSKIEANKLELEHIDFDVNQILTECIESLANQADMKGLELILDTSLIFNPKVNGDPGRVRQILTNLISNAVKFTTEGHIVVTLTQVRQQQHWQLQMTVEDTGIGIADDKLPHLFSAFNQLDSSTTREFGGSGLGLAIVRNLCELMGGNVAVESLSGKGSRFTATVNLARAITAEPEPMTSLRGKHVLLIEDHERSGDVLRHHFEEAGASIVVAKNGRDAAEKALQDHRDYDLVLVDYDIQGDDWRRTAARLAALPNCDTALRLLMVPVSYQQNNRIVESGDLHGHIQKPLNIINLMSYMTYRQHAHQEPPGAGVPLPSFSGKRVLLVEDNHVNQLVAEEMLSALGIQVDIAEHGQKALDMLSSSKFAPYDLVLMDCQMPVMDGYQATRSLRHGRAGEINQSVPVIAMTAHAMTGDKERCLASGMNDYLPKPVDPHQLHLLLERWLGVTAAQEKEELPALRSATPISSNFDSNIWDRSQALNRVVGNQSLLNQLIDMFRSEQPVRLQEMREAVQRNDLTTLQEIAHSLKGVAGNLGIVQVQNVAAALDQDLRNGVTDNIPQHIRQLQDATDRFMSMFQPQEVQISGGTISNLRSKLLGIRTNLIQNDYISQKSLDFLYLSYSDAAIESELANLAREITAFENTKAQTRLNKLLEQIKSPNNDY